MAATGYTPIYLYYSSTTSNTPSAGNLGYGELAINITDKNLFFKDNTNVVNTVPIRQSNASSNGWLSSTDWSTFNGKQAALVSGTNIKTVNGTSLLGSGDVGTIDVAHGGTAKTSFNAGQVIYGSFSQSTKLYFDGTNLGVGTSSPTAGSGTQSAIDVTGPGVFRGSLADSQSNAGVLDYSSNDLRIRAYGATAGSGSIAFRVAGGGFSADTEAMRISNTTDVTISSGNLVIGTSGKGIDFSATAGTGTSELLADYEEGTWTPTVTPETGAFTTVTVTNATYTKIGRIVTVQTKFVLTNAGTGAGSINIAGLPYTANAVYGASPFMCRRVNDGITLFGQVGTTSIYDIRTVAYAAAIVNGNTYAATATYTV